MQSLLQTLLYITETERTVCVMKKLLAMICVVCALTVPVGAVTPYLISLDNSVFDGSAVIADKEALPLSQSDVADAVEASRRVLADTTVYDEFRYDSYTRAGEYGSEITLNLCWTDTVSGDCANVSVNTDGYIISFSKSYDSVNDRPVPEISQAEALALAYDFVCAANPESAEYYSPDYANVNYRKYNATYSVSFSANKNGIMIPGASAQVILSYITGEIYSYSTSLSSKLDSANEKLLEKEEIRALFLEKYPMKLEYSVKYDRESKKSYVDLVYTPSGTDKLISADGELLERINVKGGYRFDINSSVAFDKAETESGVNGAFGLTGAESTGIEYQDSFYKPEDVSALLMAHSEIDFDEESKILESNLYKTLSPYTDKVTYKLWVHYESEGYITSVEMDAQSGEIFSYSSYDKNYEQNSMEGVDITALTDEFKAISDELVKKLYPDTYTEYVLDDNGIYIPDEINTWNGIGFVYTRYNQGLPFERDAIGIVVRLGNKKVTSISYNYSDCEFPSVEGIISAEEALDIYIHNVGIEPMLYPAVKLEDGKIYVASGDTTTAQKRLFLGYGYTYGYYEIDAHTGESDNVVTKSEYFRNIAFTDVNDAVLHKKLNTLADMNIIKRADKFEPEHIITQGEYAQMLQSVLPIPEVYASEGDDTAVFGENYDPDKPLTRANAVKAIVYAKGYSEVAELEGIYVTRFKDDDKIPADVKGYVAIAQGLSLLDNVTPSFMPEAEVTKAFAAELIYAEVCR